MYRSLRYFLFSIGFIIFSTALYGQHQEWRSYIAQYEDGPGSTTLDMSLKVKAPVKILPFILVTGVRYQNFKDGLPSPDELDKLYIISDSITSVVNRRVKSISAGTFTHKSERLNYIYLADTTNVRKILTDLYTVSFKSYEYYINIKPDGEWDAYLNFLYPSDAIMPHMQQLRP